jgi:hypothetical protein
VEKKQIAHFNQTIHVHKQIPVEKGEKEAIKSEEKQVSPQKKTEENIKNTSCTPLKRQQSDYSSPSPKKAQKTTSVKKITTPTETRKKSTTTLHAFFQPK